MAEQKLLIVSEDGKEYAEKLRALKLPELSIEYVDASADIRAKIGNADILLVEPWGVKEYIDDAKALKWVQTTTVGVDALIKEGMRTDYVLTNARGILGPKLSEYVFGHILAHKKRIIENYELQKQKKWDQVFTDSLDGQTITILGTGSIGAHIAMVAKSFGMRTLGYRTIKRPVEHFDEVYGKDELAFALAEAEYVVSVLPATPETDSIICSETIGYMKNGVVFMNIGRGNAVAETDVLQAVKTGKIARAILDVFRTEPLPEDSPLWFTENIVVTPHMAGYAGTDALTELFAENYRRFLAGETLKYQVDFKKGY